MFTNDMLLNQLRRDGPRIEKSFDKLCSDDLNQLSDLFSTTYSLICSGFVVARQKQDELRIACAELMTNACSSFTVAVAVLRMGYVLQPGIVIRSLLEAVSTTLHLILQPDDLTSYQNHTLQSPKTIATAKKVLPVFGPLYGHFSDNFVHIGHLHKSITPIKEYTERHEALEINLSSLRIAAWNLYVTAEFAFNDLVEHPRYWSTVEEGYRYAPSEAEKAWMKSFFHMEEI